jgi:hypothetical protein
METILDFIQNLLFGFGVRMRCYGEDFSGLDNFDEGLRSRLFKKTDASVLAESLRRMEEKVMYLWNDAYGCRYCFFRISEASEIAPSIMGGGGGDRKLSDTVLSDLGLERPRMTRQSMTYSDRGAFPIICGMDSPIT